MRSLSFVALSITTGGLLPACTAATLDVSASEIVDGMPAAGAEDDAIVAVLTGGGLGLCSGTLIAPELVLTAKHCVMPEGASEPLPASVFSVGTGPNLGRLHTEIGVRAVLATPGTLDIESGVGLGADIAFLVLEEPFPGVTPIPASMTPAEIGQSVVAIGFGRQRVANAGTRMRVDATVTDVTPLLVEGIEVICQGDSGGPLLRVLPDGTREVVGVASFGRSASPGGCPAVRDYWNRVDLHPDLFTEARLAAGECVVLGDEACNSVDDDCNGTIDDGCAPIGGACATDADCAFAALPDGFTTVAEVSATCSGGVCVIPCDVLAPGSSCGSIEHPFGGSTALAGLYCAQAAAGACTGECRPGAPGAGAFGAACTAATECASLLCTAGRCATPCEFETLSCASGEACTATAAGACGGCVDPALVPGGRGRGEPCTTAEVCASGVCGWGTCSRACTADRDCGAGMHCEGDYCALGGRSNAGETCSTEADCIRGLCGSRGGGRFCGSACGTCSASTVCTSGVCAPMLGVLGEACAADAECASGRCLSGACAIECGAGGRCPIGTRCTREGEEAFCRRPATGGGCSATRSAPPSGWTLVALGLALARAARRGRRR